MMETVVLSLGSNLDNRAEVIKEAILNLSKFIHNCATSPLYETEPVGNKNQPWFLNGVLKGETLLSPHELLHCCKELEEKAGRDIFAENTHEKPRPLDIDIILYGNHVIQEPNLVIPHPRLQLRRFVLVPFVNIAAEIIHPVLKKTAAQLLMECKDNSIVRPA